MKLAELIQRLNDVAEDLAHSGVDVNEIDVLVGVQPTYPLTNVVAGIISGEELADYCERPLDDLQRNAVWLAADAVPSGSPHSPYAPRPLWDAIS